MTELDLSTYAWVRLKSNSIAYVFDRVRFVRGGTPSNPAEAMRILQALALLRETDDLLEMEPAQGPAREGRLDRLDTLAVLALAALTRPVGEAAQLAIGRWRRELAETETVGRRSAAEPGADPETGTDPETRPTRLTDGIVHDVMAQRTVPEVAVFIQVCQQAEDPGAPAEISLVHKALTAFAGPASGRTNLDKALLYIALTDQGCKDAAELLLDTALKAAAASPAPEPDGIVRAFTHVSPSDRIVESYFRRQLKEGNEDVVLPLVAALLVAEPAGAESLAANAGREWSVRQVGELCKILVQSSRDCFASLLGYAASRTSHEALHRLIVDWQTADALNPSLRLLLADIVADGGNGAPGPRPIAFLQRLQKILQTSNAPDECRRLLRVAIAEHVQGRSGEVVAELLGEVDGRDLRRTAQVVNGRLSEQLRRKEIDDEHFVRYLLGLQKLGRAASPLTFWAVRERADPKHGDPLPPRSEAEQGRTRTPADNAAILGAIAARMFTADQPAIAVDLLERYLENEQAVTPAHVTAIVRRVREDSALAEDPRWPALLAATMGRWADERGRDEVAAALRAHGYLAEENAVVNTVH
ncbi:hypothetical protein KDL01_06425 [Actinospica durhamensis]|uniref:Uncharacterized protein n=1 Tax=Actinospica durhamensis TaxID=1508375 RepID=A0A941IMI3_9ACTN|nr:hypothetical protein [Actinospica durhamensis]MBR7832889.1 hypothetical protein [Actinospica durhamensis]